MRRPFLKLIGALSAMTINIFGIRPVPPSPTKNNVQFYWRHVAGVTPQAVPFMQVDGVEYPFAVGAAGQTSLVFSTGSFTPGIQGSITPGTYTDDSSVCYYARLGALVFVTGYINFEQVSDGSGGIVLTGLPYTGRETRIPIPYIADYTLGAGYTHMMGYISEGATQMFLYKVNNTGNTISSVSDVGTIVNFSFNGCYITTDP